MRRPLRVAVEEVVPPADPADAAPVFGEKEVLRRFEIRRDRERRFEIDERSREKV